MSLSGPFSLYVHFPFCKSFCKYCSFPRGLFSNEQLSVYPDLIRREIELLPAEIGELSCKTVFVGGGTPSLMPPEFFEELLFVLKSNFDLQDVEEFSIELNPEDVDENLIENLLENGVNRFSLGVQTFNSPERIGRRHSAEKALSVLDLFKRKNLNFNVDLIFGLPSSSLKSFESDLKTALSFNPSHMSVYGLGIEENSYYFRHPPRDLPSEELWSEMYYFAEDFLQKHGFKHYEISNYALESKECVHNLGYWTGRNFLGLGAGAASRWNKMRWYSPFPFEKYAERLSEPLSYSSLSEWADDFEILNKIDELKERIFTGLRLSDGIKLEKNVYDCLKQPLKSLSEEGLLIVDDGNVKISKKGLIVSDFVIGKIIESLDKVCIQT